MRYLNDWIWLRLSNRYNVASATHSLGDVYNRWVNETVGDLGVDLVDFYLDRIPDAESLNDAEYAFWAGGPLHDAVLWLDAGSTHPSLVKVPNLGSGGSVLDAQYGNGSTASTFPTLLEHTGENYVYFPGVVSNLMHVPDSAALSITGDLELVMRLSLDDMTPSPSNTYSFSKRATTGNQRSWLVEHTTGGFVALYWSNNGTSEPRSQSTAALPVSDGQVFWLKITLDVDNGASGNDVKFWWAADQATEPVSWTQLGSTVTTAGTTSIFDSTARVQLSGWEDGGSAFAGKVYRGIVRNGIGGSTVLDINMPVDVPSGDRTSFTATTGQTVTVGRATSGRKTVLVDRNVWLFGTDDYLEVADNDLLDFGATDSFTIMAVRRTWGTINNNSVVGKGTGDIGATMQGYQMFFSGGAPSYRFGDGATRVGGLGAPTPPAGDMRVITMHRDVATDRGWGETNGVESSLRTTDTTTGTLANAEPLFVGGTVATGRSDMELFAVAVWRRTLTADEIDLLAQYYGLSVGPWGGLVLGEDGVPILTETGDVINVE